MDFLNRDKERSQLKGSLTQIQNGIEQCIWIEGSSGTGKSYFVRYMKSQENPPVFCFDDYSWLYKCNVDDVNKEFSYIIAIVSDFQYKYPDKFNNYLINYFNKINNISWIEVLVHLIPNIKYTEWAKDIISNSAEGILGAKKDISSRLYSQGLPKFFAEMILHMLCDVEKRNNVLFCIDDGCWLDDNSIKTINIMLNLLSFTKEANLKISFAIITRGKDELESTLSNYEMLENVFKEYYGTLQYIFIKNFDLKTTKEYVALMNKTVILEKSTIIHKITGGNPQELYQALKIDNEDLLELCDRRGNDENYNKLMSNELLYNLIKKEIYILPILACISLLHTTMLRSRLPLLVQTICRKLNISFNYANYDEGMLLLTQNDLISISRDKVEIVHDSIKEIIKDYLKNNGEYSLYLDSIVVGLEEYSNSPDVMKEIFYLYRDYNPGKCFSFFITNYQSNHSLDSDIYKVVAESLAKDISLFTTSNLNEYIIPVILKECTFLSLYDVAYALCCLIYPISHKLSSRIKFRYLILFTKILIDMALLDTTQQYNAITIIHEALEVDGLNADEQMEAYLLAMSAYEHILDFDNIVVNNTMATNIYGGNVVSDYLKAMYLRNQGLVKSHIVLKNSYEEAIEYAERIDDIREKKLMLGTCHNNLGLSYWYAGSISNAQCHFNIAKQHLEDIGYDVFRVLNNISMCYLLENNFQEAYKTLLQAKALNIDCVFEKLCMQSNLAIIEWKMGQKDSAKQIALKIYDEYRNNEKKTTDELVYSSVMVNLGYFYYCEEDYVRAAAMYKESQFFKYRYNNEEQFNKRQFMLDFCLSKLDLSPSKEIDIDFNDSGQDVFKCMYAPINFAYYII